MQSNRKLGIVIIIIGLAIIGLIIYFVFGRFQNSSTIEMPVPAASESPVLPAVQETGTTTPGDRPRATQQYNPSIEIPHQTNVSDLEKISMAAAERIGSFSTQSDYGNFTDLKIFMTANMRDWVDKTVADYRASATSSMAYYGIETRALTATTKNFNAQAGTAEVSVMTERRASTEAIGGGEAYKQEITFNFVKQRNEWLIDGAYWKK